MTLKERLINVLNVLFYCMARTELRLDDRGWEGIENELDAPILVNLREYAFTLRMVTPRLNTDNSASYLQIFDMKDDELIETLPCLKWLVKYQQELHSPRRLMLDLYTVTYEVTDRFTKYDDSMDIHFDYMVEKMKLQTTDYSSSESEKMLEFYYESVGLNEEA